MSTSAEILHDNLTAVWTGLAEVERDVGEEAILDEVVMHLDLDDPPPPLAPAALVFRAIERELEPGGLRGWRGGPRTPERVRQLAIATFLGLMADELRDLRERLQAHIASAAQETGVSGAGSGGTTPRPECGGAT